MITGSRFTLAILITLTSLAVVITTVWSGTTGTLKGKVTDVKTGEPLLLANVTVVGTAAGG